MRSIDFSSWQSVLATLVGLGLVTLIGVGIRLLVMVTVQQRRERANRQINERLRTLIAAYKVLGGSFTGDLTVDPRHLRDLSRGASVVGSAPEPIAGDLTIETGAGWERPRRIRDTVEAALSDILLLGTEEHVRLAELAARELVAGRPVQTHELVVSLRDFIREALDLDPISSHLTIPMQGPTRPSRSGGGGKGEGGKREAGQGGGGGGGGGAGMGGGAGRRRRAFHPRSSLLRNTRSGSLSLNSWSKTGRADATPSRLAAPDIQEVSDAGTLCRHLDAQEAMMAVVRRFQSFPR